MVLPRAERRERLEKYNFSCMCLACREDWPRLEALPCGLEDLPPGGYRPEGPGAVQAALARVGRAEGEAEASMGRAGQAIGPVCRLLEQLHQLVGVWQCSAV